MENKLKVSIVIPCRNEKNYIQKCLDSFINQTYPKELYEVLVCDGMSDDGTREIVKRYEEKYYNVHLLNNDGLTAPKAMNIGIIHSKAESIIIFGAHAYADKYFIQKNVELLYRNKEIGCVGGTLETISENVKGEAIALAMSSPFGVGNALFRYAKEETYVDTVAFGAYKRTVLDEIGYFDDELVRNQDDEINFRVTKAGYKILLSPQIRATYYSRGSLKKLWRQYFQYGFWKVRVMQKHGGTPSIRHLVPMAFVLGNIGAAILSMFFKSIFYIWMAVLGLYIIGDLISASKLTKGKRNLLKYVPIVFPILHFSYGLGFLDGILNFYIIKSNKNISRKTTSSR